MIRKLVHRVRNKFKRKRQTIFGKNNIIENRGQLSNVTFDIIGDNNSIKIGNGTVVNNALVFIRGNNHRIVIEDRCFFGEGEWWLEDSDCSLIIHNDTTIERAHLAVTEPFSVLEINEDCMLARHVEIRTGDSHTILDKDTGLRINNAANVTLDRHVWVGAHAKILKGVRIGENSVIATSAVVTSDIPPYSIAGGIPAKVLRGNIDWKRERIFETNKGNSD